MSTKNRSYLLMPAAYSSILAIGVLCYANSLNGPFVFDDTDSIVDNKSLRSRDLLQILRTPPSLTVSGRPILNLSLAVNYEMGGFDVTGYHIANITIHIVAAFVLFALVRGTLLLPRIPAEFQTCATGMGLAATLLWVAHPLQTEAVTYVVQRCESLAALFYLLTLHSLLSTAIWQERADEYSQAVDRNAITSTEWRKAKRGVWFHSGAAVIWCILGVSSKEIVVSAPVVALLYDRTFITGSFRDSLRRRRWLYLGLFSTWALLGYLIHAESGRNGTVGFGTGVSPFRYAAAQSYWILHYIRLGLWPESLVFDYGFTVAPWSATTQITTAIIIFLLLLTFVEVAFRSAIGFLLFTFFAILAPTSSFVPIVSQVANEHRMYLPLAPLIILVLIGARRLQTRLPVSPGTKRTLAILILLICILTLAYLTHLRNRDYRTSQALWTDTVAKVPDSARAHVNYARELFQSENAEEAIGHLRLAVALAPDYDVAWSDLGILLIRQGSTKEAISCFRKWVDLDPNNPAAMTFLAVSLEADREYPEAIERYRQAIQLEPNNPKTYSHLGRCFSTIGRYQEAGDNMRMARELEATVRP